MSFWKVFGSILASKSRSKIDHDFGMLFCRITGDDAPSTPGGREVDGRIGLVFTAQMPPRAAPFLSKKGKQNDPYNPLDCFLAFLALEAGLQGRFARDLTRPGPLARRIFVVDFCVFGCLPPACVRAC